jgi:hypothetical protein
MALPKSILPSLKFFVELGDEDRVSGILSDDRTNYKEWESYLKFNHHKDDGKKNPCILMYHPKECWECRMVRNRGMTVSPLLAEEMEQVLLDAYRFAKDIDPSKIGPPVNKGILSTCISSESRSSFLCQDPMYFQRSRLNIVKKLERHLQDVQSRKLLKLTPEPEWNTK